MRRHVALGLGKRNSGWPLLTITRHNPRFERLLTPMRYDRRGEEQLSSFAAQFRQQTVEIERSGEHGQ
jgi:hypothetical protein